MDGDDEQEGDGRAIAWPLERLARVLRAQEHAGGLNPAQREALRYLARANRFSDSPGALTRYLGATKGTISQTLMALQRKGFIAKSPRAGGGKSLRLSLTDKGREAMARDPWSNLASLADGLGGKTRKRLQRGLEELLAEELRRTGLQSFGSCSTCRYFRERAHADEPHHCMLFEEALSDEDRNLVCIEHAARS